MWPFKKRTAQADSERQAAVLRVLLRRASTGQLRPVVLTSEEKEEIDRDLKALFVRDDGAYYAYPEVADVAQRGIAAVALSARGNRLMGLARSQKSLEQSSELTEKACASAFKAWRIFPEQPLYLYWFGRLLEQADEPVAAKEIFREYLRQQEAVPPADAESRELIAQATECATRAIAGRSKES